MLGPLAINTLKFLGLEGGETSADSRTDVWLMTGRDLKISRSKEEEAHELYDRSLFKYAIIKLFL